LCGEVAWVLNVLGFNDRLVDERIDNDKVCQFTGPDSARKVSGLANLNHSSKVRGMSE
jgi:hypothetical protein